MMESVGHTLEGLLPPPCFTNYVQDYWKLVSTALLHPFPGRDEWIAHYDSDPSDWNTGDGLYASAFDTVTDIHIFFQTLLELDWSRDVPDPLVSAVSRHAEAYEDGVYYVYGTEVSYYDTLGEIHPNMQRTGALHTSRDLLVHYLTEHPLVDDDVPAYYDILNWLPSSVARDLFRSKCSHLYPLIRQINEPVPSSSLLTEDLRTVLRQVLCAYVNWHSGWDVAPDHYSPLIWGGDAASSVIPVTKQQKRRILSTAKIGRKQAKRGWLDRPDSGD